MKISMTGISGNMGAEVFRQTMELPEVEFIRVLLTPKKENDKIAKKLIKEYGNRVQIVRGFVEDAEVCKQLVKGVDYVAHIAGVIPPASDANPEASYRCNYLGAIAMTDAVKAENPQPKYIHISTVALYGNRDEKHPFGRVGDPLLVSPFDCYAIHKLHGERYMLDAGLDCWVVLRQSAMLHNKMMKANISDGLMFHTAMNAPLEWVSARDSGYLLKRIFERDLKGEIPDFWKKIYNIGAGKKSRETGYDTFNDGFEMIGGSTEKFFKPNWFAARNFHGVWFADSDELENLFQYQRDDAHSFWKEIASHHKIFAMGKIVPRKLIHVFLFKKLLNHPNSPYRWVKDKHIARVTATFGSQQAAENRSADWKDYKLLAKGDFGDYDELRETANAVLLNHGYDESKPHNEWTIEDMRGAAKFRGGEVVSEQIADMYSKIDWRCHSGHQFSASPYTVLRGGHWCPECCKIGQWDFDRLAKHNPFYAQVWYDSHSKDEDKHYSTDKDGNDVVALLGDNE